MLFKMDTRKASKTWSEYHRHQNHKRLHASTSECKELHPMTLEDPNIGKKRIKCLYRDRDFATKSNWNRHIQTACKFAPNTDTERG